MQTLNKDIKNKTFKPVYLLYGEELFLKNSYKNKLKSAIAGDDTMNYNYFEGKGIDIKELISLADTMPFLSERRLILIEDSGFFKSAADELSDYLPHMPETTHIIFSETDVDKRNRMYKKVKDIGYAAEMTRQDSSQLASWAAGILSDNGRKIDKKTMELFLDMVGDDMENIKSELDKLISYTWGHDSVTAKDVEIICTTKITNKIFDMVAAIVAGNTKTAMDLYEDLLILKEPPMRILFLIARQFNQLLMTKELITKGSDKGTIASKLKVPPFAVSKLMQQARAFDLSRITSYINECVQLESDVKSGKLPERLAVEFLIAKQ